MDQGPLINWDAFHEASQEGQLMDLLVKLPRERWAERDKYGYTFLHLACCGPNVAAVVTLVQSGLVDVNARNRFEDQTSAHWAASRLQPRVMEVLCAAGADMQARDKYGNTPIVWALGYAHKDGGETARVLVANGVRLNTVLEGDLRFIRFGLVAFDRGVLRCQTAVAALLHVKRAGQLWQWDKFLLCELAFAVWSTRRDVKWQ